MEVDRGDADVVEAHRRHVRHALEREAGQVVTVGESMERHIEIGAGVGAHRHDPDLERDARAVDLLGRLPGEVIGDRRHGQAGIRRHSGGDVVAEVDEPASRGWCHTTIV